MLTVAEDLDGVALAVAAGARGYLHKDASRAELRATVTQALADPTWRLAPRRLRSAEMGAAPTLTAREIQVLEGMSHGRSNAEIGRELFLSEDTVKTHARRLFKKLGASAPGPRGGARIPVGSGPLGPVLRIGPASVCGIERWPAGGGARIEPARTAPASTAPARLPPLRDRVGDGDVSDAGCRRPARTRPVVRQGARPGCDGLGPIRTTGPAVVRAHLVDRGAKCPVRPGVESGARVPGACFAADDASLKVWSSSGTSRSSGRGGRRG
ncbi:hypothetical protein SHIRM173S_09262 [Streptomyces hirsutus]